MPSVRDLTGANVGSASGIMYGHGAREGSDRSHGFYYNHGQKLFEGLESFWKQGARKIKSGSVEYSLARKEKGKDVEYTVSLPKGKEFFKVKKNYDFGVIYSFEGSNPVAGERMLAKINEKKVSIVQERK